MLNGNNKEFAPQRLDNLRELIRGKGAVRVLKKTPAKRLERVAGDGAGGTGPS